MYLTAAHVERDVRLLRQFIRENPLGILTTAIRSPLHLFIQSTHIPWLIDVDGNESETELGTLRGHMAKQNPQAKAMIEFLTLASLASSALPKGVLQEDVLVLFNGPAHHYVTPSFYKITKPTTGKVAPTWNYSAVQVYGTARIYFDPHDEKTSSYLTKQLSDLATHLETTVMGHGEKGAPRVWDMSDAPSQYIELLKKNIIGVEIEIKSINGKFKMSQEKPPGDREGVIEGFRKLNTPVGNEIADLVGERASLSDERKKGSPSS